MFVGLNFILLISKPVNVIFWQYQRYNFLLSIFFRLASVKTIEGKVCVRAKWPIQPELIPVFVALSD